MSSPRCLAAALFMSVGLTAQAQGTLTLTDITSVLALRAFAGTGTADANLPCDPPIGVPDEVDECGVFGSLGSPSTPLHGADPGHRGVAGDAWARAEDGQWSASMTLTWSTWQEVALDAIGTQTVLRAAGRHESTLGSVVGGPGAVQPGTRNVEVWNFQRIDFALDAPTSYTFEGLVFGEYMPVQLFRVNAAGGLDAAGSWCSAVGVPCTGGGLLAAGAYQLRVFEWINSDPGDRYAFGWDYRMTLADTVPAVPEASPLATLAVGLGMIGLWRRRRSQRR